MGRWPYKTKKAKVNRNWKSWSSPVAASGAASTMVLVIMVSWGINSGMTPAWVVLASKAAKTAIFSMFIIYSVIIWKRPDGFFWWSAARPVECETVEATGWVQTVRINASRAWSCFAKPACRKYAEGLRLYETVKEVFCSFHPDVFYTSKMQKSKLAVDQKNTLE